jgi:hypothetical protein
LTGNSHILAGYQLAKVEQRSTANVRSLAPTGEAAFEQLFKMHFWGLNPCLKFSAAKNFLVPTFAQFVFKEQIF